MGLPESAAHIAVPAIEACLLVSPGTLGADVRDDNVTKHAWAPRASPSHWKGCGSFSFLAMLGNF
jgi:hypothetical protein